ncbi:hypothetical protein ABZ904_18075 [Streptomyces sp. NPDC046900]|uniref:hypothetical protein n=1 Tax=Streptomyces sp. NPDC046900 TaxID=3155473 RepID=UPI00340C2C8E
MQTETLVGLISGLGGAVIGAGGALLGAWLQQRQQAKHARQERHETMARQAVDQLVTELNKLRRLVQENPSRAHRVELHEPDAWTQSLIECRDHISMAVLRLPDAELRDRINDATYVLDAGEETYESLNFRRPALGFEVDLLCREAMAALGSYLREETLPGLSRAAQRARKVRVTEQANRARYGLT